MSYLALQNERASSQNLLLGKTCENIWSFSSDGIYSLFGVTVLQSHCQGVFLDSSNFTVPFCSVALVGPLLFPVCP